MFQIVETPLEKEIQEVVRTAEKTLRLASPYITTTAFEWLLSKKRPKVKIQLLTDYRLENIVNGVTQLGVARQVLANPSGKVRSNSLLHAKLLLADNKTAYLGSGNFTWGGIKRNLEAGVICSDSQSVNSIENVFSSYWEHSNSFNVSEKILNEIDILYKRIPKVELPKSSSDFESFVNKETHRLNSTQLKIVQTLTGWRKDVFNIVLSQNKETFDLKDIYQSKYFFEQKYPNNNTIQDSIRRNLQELITLGLIQRLEPGVYTIVSD
jgi:Phosphatidylserine/phosphatidylglycerophosphate/cardiolipin synthases and related enzymes